MVKAGGWGAATDRGNLRTLNEDSYVAFPPVFVVADGMGGHAAGNRASQIVAEEFTALAKSEIVSADEALAVVDRANEAILDAARSDLSCAGMGTTLTGLISVIAAGVQHWLLINIGDSRVYRLADGHLQQLTVDHSEVQEMITSGELTREEALHYSRRNVITRSVGTEPPPSTDSWLFPPGEDERFILCSDGLTGELTDLEIETLAVAIDDPQALAQHLVSRAVSAGGRDNITVIVVDGLAQSSVEFADETTLPRGSIEGGL